MGKNLEDEFSPKETARRRDEVIRRMANTPPQHRATPVPSKKKKPIASGQATQKSAARRRAKP